MDNPNKLEKRNKLSERNKRAFKGTREPSFFRFNIKRSLGVMRTGSNLRPMLSHEWATEWNRRTVIDCGQPGCGQPGCGQPGCGQPDCDQLLFNNDGITGPNEVATSCMGVSEDASPCMKFWDVRNTCRPVASSVFQGRTSLMSSVYSKKDDLFLTLDKNANDNLLATYNRKGRMQHSSDGMPWDLSNCIKSIAISPDESILVMETLHQSFMIVRQLDLKTLFQDIQHFHPAFLRADLPRKLPEYADLYNQAGYERNRGQQSRNSPELMFYRTHSNSKMCSCELCTKSVSFSPHNDFFVCHAESFNDAEYAFMDRRVPGRIVLAIDLLEHRIARRRSLYPQQLHARYGNIANHARSYLNLQLCEIEIDPYSIGVEDLLGQPYSHTANEIPRVVSEPNYGFMGVGKVATTTRHDQPLVAVGVDSFGVRIYSYNEEFTSVRQGGIAIDAGLRRLAFSPRDSSLVLTELNNTLHWYDLEHGGPIVSVVSAGD